MIARRRAGAVNRAGYVSLLLRVLVIALAVYLALTFAFMLTQVRGQDMYPALKDGDLCVVFRTGLQTLLGEGFVQDDIVVYQAEGAQRIGRVAAVAGDTVTLNDSGVVTVNGRAKTSEILFDTFARGELTYPYTVPEGCVFLLGDHRTDTLDSRDFGPIPLESVTGKVISILRRRGL